MQSLRIDENLLVDFVMGDPRARMIVKSWKFNEPITVIPADELEEMSERTHTIFSFQRDVG